MKLLVFIFWGLGFLLHDNLDIQIDRISELISKQPDQAHLFHQRGVLFFKKEKYNQAIRDFEQCIRLDTEYAQGYIDLAEAWLQKGETEYALEYLDRLYEKYPAYYRVYWHRGLINIQFNAWDKGIQDIKKYFELSEEVQVDQYVQVVDLILKTKNNTLCDEALNFLIDATRKLGELPVLLQNQVLIYEFKEQYVQAIQTQTKLIQCFDRQEKAYYRRAMLHYKADSRNEAQQDLDKSLDLIGNLPDRLKRSQSIKELKANISLLKNLINA